MSEGSKGKAEEVAAQIKEMGGDAFTIHASTGNVRCGLYNCIFLSRNRV